jgi:hypothetical protein
MPSRRPLALAAALMFLPVEVLAGLVLELPQAESPALWEPVLQSVGLESGHADAAPWARLSESGEGCLLEVTTRWGGLEREPVDCPATSAQREDIAALAAVMLEPLVQGDLSMPLAPLPSPPPASSPPGASATSAAAARERLPAPPRSYALELSERGGLQGRSAATIQAELPAASTSPGAGPQLADGLGSTHPSIVHPRTPGTSVWSVQCVSTGCSATFEGPCVEAGGCSTAAQCPETFWADVDYDGYGDPNVPCLSPGGISRAVNFVQNVGDCDDRHSSIHAGADEVIGDGIDNNCDGVTR